MSNGVMEMSTADISALGNLAPAEPLDTSTYTDERPAFRLPPAGKYTLRAPESFPAEAFAATKSDQPMLLARVDPTIVGGEFDGFQLRFIKVSAKPYDNKNRKTGEVLGRISQAALYLKKFGITNVSENPQEIANAIASTAGKTYEAYLDWEASHWATRFTLKGMKQFPSNGDGTYQSWTTHPTEKDAEGNPLRVRANLVVRW